MATVKYFIRSEVNSKLAPIYARFADGRDIDIKAQTEFKALPEAWGKGEKIKSSSCNDIFTEKDARQLINNLGDLRQTILKACNAQGVTYSRKWLEGVIRTFHHPVQEPKPKPAPKKETLTHYVGRYIDEAENGKRLTVQQRRFAYSTVKGLRGVQEQFRLYQEKHGAVNWDDIHADFYNKYIQYFKVKGYRLNTVGRHIKGLKQILNAAINEGLTTNVEHTRRAFKAVFTDIDFAYLTAQELEVLFKADLSEHPSQALARDIFCVGCYTGQRFSDYSRIDKSHIRTLTDGRTVIDIRQQKTGKRVIIPARWELMEILSRHDYKLPHMFEQKVNEHIKKACAAAGIKEKVEIVEIVGGLKVTRSIPKNELIKTHSARRTCLTQMHHAGIPLQDIMAISGHSTERQLRTYIKADAEGTAQALSHHSFFNTPKMKVV